MYEWSATHSPRGGCFRRTQAAGRLSCCELRCRGPGLKCRRYINQRQFKREDYFNLGMSLCMFQYMVHYLLSRKVSIRAPLLSVLIRDSQTIRHAMNCKLKQAQYPKAVGVACWGQGQVQTGISFTMAHLALSFVKPRVKRWWLQPRKVLSVGAEKVGPTSIHPSWWDLPGTALTILRRKQSQVFGKLPSINSQAGLKPSDVNW